MCSIYVCVYLAVCVCVRERNRNLARGAHGQQLILQQGGRGRGRSFTCPDEGGRQTDRQTDCSDSETHTSEKRVVPAECKCISVCVSVSVAVSESAERTRRIMADLRGGERQRERERAPWNYLHI